MAVYVTTRKSLNLIDQKITPKGKLNVYAVDTMEDLQWINETQIEILGCRAYCIENGKFYIMNSNSEWEEKQTSYNEVISETITRSGVYTFTFDPAKYDGIKEVEFTFTPTLEEFEKTITRAGDYTFKYNKTDYDGWDNATIHVQPTLQNIEQEISEGGEYDITYDSENYDGIDTVHLNIAAAGGGDGKVQVNEDDGNPDYLAYKLVSEEGSGIDLIVNEEENTLNVKYNPESYYAEAIETFPVASLQEVAVPFYGNGSEISLVGSSICPSSSFKFTVGTSYFRTYTNTSNGEMRNCRFILMKINSNKSATVIAYSELFNTANILDGNVLEAKCAYASEIVKGGERYLLGIAGTPVESNWLKLYGYRPWASTSIYTVPPYNFALSTGKVDVVNNPVFTISSSDWTNNSTFYCYFAAIAGETE